MPPPTKRTRTGPASGPSSLDGPPARNGADHREAHQQQGGPASRSACSGMVRTARRNIVQHHRPFEPGRCAGDGCPPRPELAPDAGTGASAVCERCGSPCRRPKVATTVEARAVRQSATASGEAAGCTRPLPRTPSNRASRRRYRPGGCYRPCRRRHSCAPRPTDNVGREIAGSVRGDDGGGFMVCLLTLR